LRLTDHKWREPIPNGTGSPTGSDVKKVALASVYFEANSDFTASSGEAGQGLRIILASNV